MCVRNKGFEIKNLYFCSIGDSRKMTELADKIYEIVKNIPRGKVMTYGQVAERVGNKRLARVVGNVLHKNPDPANIPCHRVVNSKGELSKSFAFGGAEAQRRLLEKEGVKIIGNKIDLTEYK